MKNCSLFYIKIDGLLFIQFNKSDRHKHREIGKIFCEELKDGTIVRGNPVRLTKTGIVLDSWSIYHDPRAIV